MDKFSIPGYVYEDLSENDTVIHMDWYSADMELDIYCKCGKHFVSYKTEGEDSFLIQCPKCLAYYSLHQRLTVIEDKPSEDGEVILDNDENDLGNWK